MDWIFLGDWKFSSFFSFLTLVGVTLKLEIIDLYGESFEINMSNSNYESIYGTNHVLEYFSFRIGAEFHLVTDWRIDFSLVCGSKTALSEDNLDELSWYVRPKQEVNLRIETVFITIFNGRY